MTHRIHGFPRVDVRDVPMRPRSTPGQWARDWAEAIARARAVYAMPSRDPLPQRSTVTRGESTAARFDTQRRIEALWDFGP